MATGKQLHIDAPLSNLAIKAFDGGASYIAQQLMPIVTVDKQSNKYYTLTRNSWIRIFNTQRSRGANSNRIEFDVSNDAYFCDNRALSAQIPIEDVSNADSALRVRENTTAVLTEGLLRDYENRVASKITSSANIGSGVALTGANKWSDLLSSDPLSDVTTGHAYITNNTGLHPNTMVIDWNTLQTLKRHPKLIDYYKYTQGGLLGEQILASVFGVSKVLVGQGVKNNAPESATASITTIWGNNAILAVVNPAAGPMTQTFGLSFRWQPEGMPAMAVMRDASEMAAGKKWVEVLEAMYYQDEKVVAPSLAYGINNTL